MPVVREARCDYCPAVQVLPATGTALGLVVWLLPFGWSELYDGKAVCQECHRAFDRLDSALVGEKEGGRE